MYRMAPPIHQPQVALHLLHLLHPQPLVNSRPMFTTDVRVVFTTMIGLMFTT